MLSYAVPIASVAALLFGLRVPGMARAGERAGRDGDGRTNRPTGPPEGLALLRQRLDLAELHFGKLPTVHSEADLRDILSAGRTPSPHVPDAPETGAEHDLAPPLWSTHDRYSSRYWTARPSDARVCAAVRPALNELGRRFQQRLTEHRLPLYRFTVSGPTERIGSLETATRTLRPESAALGTRSIQIDHHHFEYVPRPEESMAAGLPLSECAHELEEIRAAAYQALGERHSPALTALLAGVLADLRREGRLSVEPESGRTRCQVAIRDYGPAAAAG